jgi:hypothetical protein
MHELPFPRDGCWVGRGARQAIEVDVNEMMFPFPLEKASASGEGSKMEALEAWEGSDLVTDKVICCVDTKFERSAFSVVCMVGSRGRLRSLFDPWSLDNRPVAGGLEIAGLVHPLLRSRRRGAGCSNQISCLEEDSLS